MLYFRMTEKQRAKLEAEAKKKLSDMRKNAASEMKLREEKLERLRVRFFKVPNIPRSLFVSSQKFWRQKILTL